jgi:hypothetical protein
LGPDRLHWQGPAATINYRPNLSSGRAPHINKPTTVYISKKEEEEMVLDPTWVADTLADRSLVVI